MSSAATSVTLGASTSIMGEEALPFSYKFVRSERVKSILIVDDDPVSLRLFTALLSTPDYELRVAKRGSEALQECALAPPDLLVLDLRLPEMSGLEVARTLKSNARTCKIPILALSAYGDGHATEEALGAGIDCFMAKPFSGVALREAVAAFVGC